MKESADIILHNARIATNRAPSLVEAVVTGPVMNVAKEDSGVHGRAAEHAKTMTHKMPLHWDR